MDLASPWTLLGGLSPERFMRRHWQKKPYLVRQAWPGVVPPVTRREMFALAARDEVESRLVSQGDGMAGQGGAWQLRRGPFRARQLPALKQPAWTLLVQGLDLHVPAARAMLDRFRFVPEARLDDLMVSFATDGGGVGPHLDSYDVFLLQVQGRRRWRIGPVRDERLVEGLPVRILRHFAPDEEFVLEPGDMLYLPPRWGHDGIAEGECMTCSIGFRVPAEADLAADLMARLADVDADEDGRLYRDPAQRATNRPAQIPAALATFAQRAVARRLRDARALQAALGESLTDPKPAVWFDGGVAWSVGQPLALDRRTRMMYDTHHVFINGESFRAAGRDARLLRELADRRRLGAKAAAQFSAGARELVAEWAEAGWLRIDEEPA